MPVLSELRTISLGHTSEPDQELILILSLTRQTGEGYPCCFGCYAGLRAVRKQLCSPQGLQIQAPTPPEAEHLQLPPSHVLEGWPFEALSLETGSELCLPPSQICLDFWRGWGSSVGLKSLEPFQSLIYCVILYQRIFIDSSLYNTQARMCSPNFTNEETLGFVTYPKSHMWN